jgi:hypothetical protein
VIVIALKTTDADACFGHPPRDFPELAGLLLVQRLDQNFAHARDRDTRCFQGLARDMPVDEEELSDSGAVFRECAAAFDADSSAAQSVTHLRESSGTVFGTYRYIVHTDF